MQQTQGFNLHNVTLECFSKRKVPNTANEVRSLSRQQKSFYRKRILATTKELARGKCSDETLKSAYDAYAAQLIENFKASDKSFLLQKEFAGIHCKEKEKMPQANFQPDNSLFTGKKNDLESYVVRRRVKKKKDEHVPKLKQINLQSAQFRRPRKGGN